jgi:formylglycine-generating enzyme required for sulfatase activity
MEVERFNIETPQHQVTVPKFYMGKFKVTQAQWRAVANMPEVGEELYPDLSRFNNISILDMIALHPKLYPDPSRFKGDNLPVGLVRWDDAVEFCKRLSKKTGREYRLPSEAEWEYAARAGTQTPFAFGEAITPEIVNYDGNYPYARAVKGTKRGMTVAVGSLGWANGFGLYDMHGNGWEWCLDHWHKNYRGAPTDGSAWLNGGDSDVRVVRGGSSSSYGFDCRSASREGFEPDYPLLINFGLRVVAVAPT